MSSIEQWVLRIADSDMTWFGLSWLRPPPHRRITSLYVLLSSIVLGLPGLVVGAGLIYLFIGRLEPAIWLWMVALVLSIELALHIIFAHFWNRRADSLAQDVPPP
jgi:ABC-type Fe3+ transport system permease subunit